MKNKFLIILVCAISILTSCKNKLDNDVSDGTVKVRKIFLPSAELLRSDSVKNINPLSKEIKIFTVIDGGCAICVDKLLAWKKYMKDIDTSQVGFVMLIYSEDSLFTFKELNKNYVKFSYPYFHDIKKSISLKINLIESKTANTFLLNSKNEVIVSGDPTESKKIFNQYKIEINKKIKKKKPSLVVEEEPNGTKFTISEGFIYKNQEGKTLKESEWKRMMSDNNYLPNIDTEKGIITITKK
jgi:hypothetical protein